MQRVEHVEVAFAGHAEGGVDAVDVQWSTRIWPPLLNGMFSFMLFLALRFVNAGLYPRPTCVPSAGTCPARVVGYNDARFPDAA